MNTKPEQRTQNYYEELEVLFNYIDYQLKKGNYNQAAPAILELYDSILCQPFLKNKESEIFGNYDNLLEKSDSTMYIENGLICQIFILSNRHKRLLYDEPILKEEIIYYQKRKEDLLLMQDSVNHLIQLNPRLDYPYKVKFNNRQYNLLNAFNLNPSATNYYFIINEKLQKCRQELGKIERQTRKYWETGIANVFDYCALNSEDYLLEELREELLEPYDLVNRALKNYGDCYFFYELLGEIHYLKGEHETALKWILKSIELYSINYKAWSRLFNILMQVGRFQEITMQYDGIKGFEIYSDKDYSLCQQIAKVAIRACGEIEAFKKGIEVYVYSEKLFNDYYNKRNSELELWPGGHNGFYRSLVLLHNNVCEKSTTDDAMRVAEVIVREIGYDSTVCKNYVLAYLSSMKDMCLKDLSYSELENICIDEDVEIPSSPQIPGPWSWSRRPLDPGALLHC